MSVVSSPALARGVAIEAALDAGFAFGMFQHRNEMRMFLRWFLYGIPVDNRIDTVIEIGAHKGGTAALFCSLGARRVISVDWADGPWGGIGGPAAESRDAQLLTAYPGQYLPIAGNSHDPQMIEAVANLARGHRVNLLFIDGDHSLPGVTADFAHYSPLVHPAGVIAMHDVNDTPHHRRIAVKVPEFWRGVGDQGYVFSIGEFWGGIGALRVAA